MSEAATKICTRCDEEKELGCFYSRGGGRLASACKECCLKQKREQYRNDPAKKAESDRRYREQNREAVAERKREWYEQNKDRIREQKRLWAERNADDIRAKKRQYQLANAEKIAAYLRSYGVAKRAEISKNKKRYAIENRERLREKWLLQKAYRTAAVPAWDVELTELVTLEASRLARLREKLVGGKWHVDHVVPLRGRRVCGLHVWNNLGVVPSRFNLMKSNRLLDGLHERSWL